MGRAAPQTRGRRGAVRGLPPLSPSAAIHVLCVDVGLILHRTPAEVAATVSFPEARAILARDELRQTRLHLAATHSRYLATAAKWSKEAGADFQAYVAELSDLIDPAPTPKLTRHKAASFFAALGLRPAVSGPRSRPND